MIFTLDLFSGIGGFALACLMANEVLKKDLFQTVAFCEIEEFCRRVLTKNFHGIPVLDDVKQFNPTEFLEPCGRGIDLITAGFPCQDLSHAGRQAGIHADRSGLFFEILRISDEIHASCGTRPILLLENVPAILTGDGGDWARVVYGELAQRYPHIESQIISAEQMGALHKRDRWWCICFPEVGNANSESINIRVSRSTSEGSKETPSERLLHTRNPSRNDVPDSNSSGCKEQRRSIPVQEELSSSKCSGSGISKQSVGLLAHGTARELVQRGPDWWSQEPDIPRVTTGESERVSKLKSLGNGIVPHCAVIPLLRIAEYVRSINGNGNAPSTEKDECQF